MANAVNWFEIPASNFKRAVDFYCAVMSIDMPVHDMMGSQLAFFAAEDGGVGGCVATGEGYVPSAEGSTVYLNGGDDLSVYLNKVESCGGKVLMPKTKISDEVGHIAMFLDTEGNKVAFHSPN